MPSIGTVEDQSTIDLLPEKRDLLREPYLDMVKAMIKDKAPRQLRPGEGETLRKLKVNVTRAATELGVRLTNRETRDGTLYVYLKPDPKVKASANGAANTAVEYAPQEEEVGESAE